MNTEAILDNSDSHWGLDPAKEGKETAPCVFLDW